MLIVTGMHRSGTTFIGSVIEQSKVYDYIHEPFNLYYGVEGVDQWYPYLDPNDDSSLTQILDNLHSLNIKFKDVENKKDNFFKSKIRTILKSKGNLDLIKYKIKPLFMRKEILLKDPFLSLCSGYLAKKYDDTKIIYVVRHPVAIYNSVKRMNWDFDFEHLVQQHKLMKHPCVQELQLESLEKTAPLHIKVAFLWKVLYCIVHEQSNTLKDKTMIVIHENFSENPYTDIKRMFTFLNIDLNSDVEKFIELNMFGGAINVQNDKLHNFKRNSKELAYSWKQKWKPEYDEIIKITDNVLQIYYPQEKK